ncbi:MAG TPA: MFS transporter, partial [Gemmataceae bacterium]|nr:MFS transporter [Gemmataceae bacterium]
MWRTPATSLAEQVRRRITIRLIPFLFFLYILAYLDRVNASVALLQMNASPAEGGLGFTSEIIGFGTALFFWAYWILEIPSTITVARRGARWVFVRVLVLWGFCATLLGSIGSPFAAQLLGWIPGVGHSAERQFYVLQFLLGFFEGGFFPSVIVYLSYWFRTEDRAKAIAGFMAAIPLSGVIGTPISGLLLGVHWLGLPGWRWVFILEGTAPVLAAGLTIFYLPNRPAEAAWLPPEERAWLLAELEREHEHKVVHRHFAWRHKIGAVLLLTSVYFCLNVTSYGLGMFMPKMIKTQTSSNELVSWVLTTTGMSRDLLASLLTGVASVLAFLAMQINGRHSDRTGERPWHAAVPLGLWGLALALAAALHFAPFWSAVVMV